jgi:hypothetical protein
MLLQCQISLGSHVCIICGRELCVKMASNSGMRHIQSFVKTGHFIQKFFWWELGDTYTHSVPHHTHSSTTYQPYCSSWHRISPQTTSHSTSLQHTISYHNSLHWISLYHAIPYHTVQYYTTHHATLHCTTVQHTHTHTPSYHNSLHWISPYHVMLHKFTPHCISLHHTTFLSGLVYSRLPSVVLEVLDSSTGQDTGCLKFFLVSSVPLADARRAPQTIAASFQILSNLTLISHPAIDHILIDRHQHSDIWSFRAAFWYWPLFGGAKVEERLAVSTRILHRFHLERFNLENKQGKG